MVQIIELSMSLSVSWRKIHSFRLKNSWTLLWSNSTPDQITRAWLYVEAMKQWTLLTSSVVWFRSAQNQSAQHTNCVTLDFNDYYATKIEIPECWLPYQSYSLVLVIRFWYILSKKVNRNCFHNISTVQKMFPLSFVYSYLTKVDCPFVSSFAYFPLKLAHVLNFNYSLFFLWEFLTYGCS
jgi:hypothetical protein